MPGNFVNDIHQTRYEEDPAKITNQTTIRHPLAPCDGMPTD